MAVSSAPRTMSTISRCSINIYCLNKWPPNRALLPLLPPVVCLHRSQRDPWKCEPSPLTSLLSISHCIPPHLTLNLKSLPWPARGYLIWPLAASPTSFPTPLPFTCSSPATLAFLSFLKHIKHSFILECSSHITHFLTLSSALLKCYLLREASSLITLSNSTCPSLYPLILVLYFFYSSY